MPSSDTNSDAITFLTLILLYDAESQVGGERELDHPGLFQFDLLGTEMLEQSDTFAK